MRNGENNVSPIVCSAIRMFHVKTSREIAVESDTEVKVQSHGEFLISFGINRYL
jgi:hypothetical protein